MLSNIKGIVLHYVKFGESSLITTIYTNKYGRQSYVVNSAWGKKAKNKASLLQPLFLIDMVVYHKQSREVQRLKEFKISAPFQTLPFDIRKSTQAIFLAEILYKTLKEEEGYPQLFNFIENSILYLDLIETDVNNFHLFFLSRLTEFLGFFPNFDNKNDRWFDLKKGISKAIEPTHSSFMDQEETLVFKQLISLKINNLSDINLNNIQRSKLLNRIIEYYQLHFDTMGEIKSISVLKEVFE
jgi:DNA repair protein RecO (recombination protein O)